MMISSIFPGIYQQAQKSQQLSGSLAFLGWWSGMGLHGRKRDSSTGSTLPGDEPTGAIAFKHQLVPSDCGIRNEGRTVVVVRNGSIGAVNVSGRDTSTESRASDDVAVGRWACPHNERNSRPKRGSRECHAISYTSRPPLCGRASLVGPEVTNSSGLPPAMKRAVFMMLFCESAAMFW